MKRLLLPLLGLLAAAPAWAQPAPLRLVSPWEISSLDPSRTGYIFNRLEVAETLLGADDGGLPQPRLATAWTMGEDGLTWHFTLRTGATFHDGTPLTAAHAVAALQRAMANPGPLATAPIASIEADGAHRVVIRTRTPLAALPAFLAHSSTQVLAPASFDADGAVRQVIGSGPYRISSIAAPLRIETAAAATYDLPAPAIRAISYQVVPRAETRAVMAESGQADLVFVLDAASWDRLRRNTRIRLEVLPVPRTQVLKLNAATPFFEDARARLAVSMAIDRDGIARAILRNPDGAANQLFPPILAEWQVPNLPPAQRDAAGARALLAEAGWMPGPDGILAKGGKPFRLTLRTFSDRPELPVVAAALQDQMRDIGIDLRVAVANSSEIPAGHRDGTLEMGLLARAFTLVPDPIGTLLQDFGPQGGEWGAMNWSDPALTAVLTELTATAEPKRRAALRQEAARILAAQLPVIPIAWYDYSVAVSKRLANVSVDPLELSYRISAMRWAE
jgi:peptide/nickel transport system substrate-binding protein